METGVKRVYVGGTFDLFHPGHVSFLKQAARFGQIWVALNTDAFCRRYKRQPIMSYRERETMLRACIYVHEVVVNEGDEDSKPAIIKVRPDYLIHGDDWTGERYLAQLGLGKEWLDEHWIQLVHIPYTKGISSSDIIQRCRNLPPKRNGVAQDAGQPPLPDETPGGDPRVRKRVVFVPAQPLEGGLS